MLSKQRMHLTCRCCAAMAVLDFESEIAAVSLSGHVTVTLENCRLSLKLNSQNIYRSAALRIDTLFAAQRFIIEPVVRLKQCTFPSNSYPSMIAVYSSVGELGVYSDPRWSVFVDDRTGIPKSALPLEHAPINRAGINASSPWLIELQQVSLCVLLQFRFVVQPMSK